MFFSVEPDPIDLRQGGMDSRKVKPYEEMRDSRDIFFGQMVLRERAVY